MRRFHVCMPVADAEGGFSCFVCVRDMAAELRQYGPLAPVVPIHSGAAASHTDLSPPHGWVAGRRARRLRPA